MKPLTAEDLVVGGKYVIYYTQVTYKERDNDARFVFVTTNGNKVYARDLINVTPYHEPNQCCGRCDGVNDFCINDESTMMELESLHEPKQTTMNTDYTEQPFNLETALKHPEWVRTRDGREIDFIKEYPERTTCTLAVVLKDGDALSYFNNGSFYLLPQSPNDLILRVPYRTVYTVLYPEKNAYWYDTEAEALADSKDSNYIACVPIKIPAI